MNRRDFLRNILSATMGMALITTKHPVLAQASATKGKSLLDGMLIIDLHAHPDWMNPSSASFRFMKEVGMAASGYFATGIMDPVGTIDNWMNKLVKKGHVKLVLKMSDIPAPGTETPGAILGLEGGEALEGRVDRVGEFYKLGVRIITIVHYNNNELGSAEGTRNGGLTPKGRAVIDRMQELGMVVDVAHCSTATLNDVVAYCKKPVVDSHTLLCATENSCGRARTWKEMERISSTGGVVCSCPGAWNKLTNKTILDWANELMDMKKKIGIEHIGIGTDGGGPMGLVSGYNDVRDLTKLAEALTDVGFSREELAAFMGKNVYRVLSKYLS